jgi:hypothetical protein
VSNAATSLVIDANGHSHIAFQTTGNTVRVANYDGLGWTIDTLANGTLSGAQGESLDYLNGTLGLAYVDAGGNLSFAHAGVSAIPEPSTYALFAGLGALALARWRRRVGELL